MFTSIPDNTDSLLEATMEPGCSSMGVLREEDARRGTIARIQKALATSHFRLLELMRFGWSFMKIVSARLPGWIGSEWTNPCPLLLRRLDLLPALWEQVTRMRQQDHHRIRVILFSICLTGVMEVRLGGCP